MIQLEQQLAKVLARLKGKQAKWPPQLNSCPSCGGDISFQLAGLWLKEHGEEIMEALKREPTRRM